jgi:hypothetical protein
METG